MTQAKNQPIPEINSLQNIIVKGARAHNLANIDVVIPKNKLVVFSGLSGSGKSSLAFDTLYAEGQRRYVESLSSYARQFLGIMNKPDVDNIEGLSPAISIDQKTTSHNPRSTVGTITEIYDYLRLLYARVGHPHCPECGEEISTQSIDQIINHVINLLESNLQAKPISRAIIFSPIIRQKKGEFSALFKNLQKKGYQKVRLDGQIYNLNEHLELIKTNKHNIEVLIDRLTLSKVQLKDSESLKTLKSRLNSSLEEALKLADGLVIVSEVLDESFDFPEKPQKFLDHLFSEKLACSNCGISIKDLEPRLFSFNAPDGACEHCNGLGSILKIDQEKIIAPSLSLSEGAVIPFARVLSTDSWWSKLIKAVVEGTGHDYRKTAFGDLSQEAQDILLYGSDQVYEVVGENRFGKITVNHHQFEGFINNLERRYKETDSDFMRREIEQYMVKMICPVCHGARLNKKALSVYIDHKNIADFANLTILEGLKFVEKLNTEEILNKKEKIIASSILKEITARLNFLSSVGLNYLTLSREAGTLAGGEAQRIRLASQIGTGLSGVLYILDEPTIGLHQRDNHKLIETLKSLRDKGNSVVVVEHDRDVLLAADQIIDFGPLAGKQGGRVVFSGQAQEILSNKDSLTGQYLARIKDIKRKTKKSPSLLDENADYNNEREAIIIRGAKHHNLKSIDVNFPLHTLTCITGISGSGKSTLLHDTLYQHLSSHLGKKSHESSGELDQIMIPETVRRVSLIDQRPIGRTPRSNPATYTKVFDYIRQIFANTKDAKIRGYNIGRFSFNVKGGRCETCKGDGQLKIEMQFLPDVYVTCDVCHGKRYNNETLEVRYKDKNIAEILDMTIDEAYEFFTMPILRRKLKTLLDVGLGYLQLGQSAPTLSGGEAQRVKLAKELSIQSHDHTVYLLDEPTTGLHFHDVQKLLNVLTALVEQGNTVIVIEHNLDVIKNADYIIDLGPEGGEYGGEIVAMGNPQMIARNKNSFTGYYLDQEFKLKK